MPFRPMFDCLWCGTPWTVRGPDDLEGFAQLCPACVGRAGENEFLRFRLKAALADRAKDHGGRAAGSGSGVGSGGRGSVRRDGGVLRGPSRRVRRLVSPPRPVRAGTDPRPAWTAELDQATLWLDALPIGGEVVELAAGTGWWSPLLASKGKLSIYDASEAPLDRARDRLVAHGLRAHIHVRDAWAEPDRQVDALFCGFWLSHVPRARLGEFLALVRRWLKPGGLFAFIDSRPDPQSGAVDQPISPEPEVSGRRLADGREFRVVKVFYEPSELEAELGRAGFASAEVRTTTRFFLLGRATA